jgi:hypothetical protein
MCDVPSIAVFIIIIIIIITIIIIIMLLLLSLVTGLLSPVLHLNQGDPHHSGFQFQTAALSVLCAMFHV